MRTLFRSPSDGGHLSYEELWNSVVGRVMFSVVEASADRSADSSSETIGEVEWADVVQSRNVMNTVVALSRAVLLQQPLTLLDSDYSSLDLKSLGIYTGRVNVVMRIPGVRASDLNKAMDLARREAGFGLTIYTSGTTGVPKPVTHTLDGLTRMLKVSASHSNDVWALTYNPSHLAGVQVVLQALFNRNPLVNLFGADRSEVIESIAKFGITHISATPSFYRLILPLDQPIKEVQSVTLGGECGDAQLVSRLRDAFPNARIHNIYALTEVGAVLVANGDVFTIESGKKTQVRLIEGRLHVHRDLLGATDSAAPTSEWFDTGDCVESLGQDPVRFRIVARETELVNVGGYRVNPHEIEGVMREFPNIADVRVVGRVNSVTGQILCAEVVVSVHRKSSFVPPGETSSVAEAKADVLADSSRSGVSGEVELRRFLAERLPAYKIPRLIRQVQMIPHTSTGKISRR